MACAAPRPASCPAARAGLAPLWGLCSLISPRGRWLYMGAAADCAQTCPASNSFHSFLTAGASLTVCLPGISFLLQHYKGAAERQWRPPALHDVGPLTGSTLSRVAVKGSQLTLLLPAASAKARVRARQSPCRRACQRGTRTPPPQTPPLPPPCAGSTQHLLCSAIARRGAASSGPRGHMQSAQTSHAYWPLLSPCQLSSGWEPSVSLQP